MERETDAHVKMTVMTFARMIDPIIDAYVNDGAPTEVYRQFDDVNDKVIWKVVAGEVTARIDLHVRYE